MLHAWAVKHGISLAALQDLQIQMGALDAEFTPTNMLGGLSEAAVQANRRLEASRRGGRLWRNNVGALKDKGGRLVRYGLANDSDKMNDVLKSSDLIGINPVLITPTHVGTVIGQFDAEECKESNWRFTGTEEEEAQLRFLQLVISLGGRAKFTTGRE